MPTLQFDSFDELINSAKENPNIIPDILFDANFFKENSYASVPEIYAKLMPLVDRPELALEIFKKYLNLDDTDYMILWHLDFSKMPHNKEILLEAETYAREQQASDNRQASYLFDRYLREISPSIEVYIEESLKRQDLTTPFFQHRRDYRVKPLSFKEGEEFLQLKKTKYPEIYQEYIIDQLSSQDGFADFCEKADLSKDDMRYCLTQMVKGDGLTPEVQAQLRLISKKLAKNELDFEDFAKGSASNIYVMINRFPEETAKIGIAEQMNAMLPQFLENHLKYLGSDALGILRKVLERAQDKKEQPLFDELFKNIDNYDDAIKNIIIRKSPDSLKIQAIKHTNAQLTLLSNKFKELIEAQVTRSNNESGNQARERKDEIISLKKIIFELFAQNPLDSSSLKLLGEISNSLGRLNDTSRSSIGPEILNHKMIQNIVDNDQKNELIKMLTKSNLADKFYTGDIQDIFNEIIGDELISQDVLKAAERLSSFNRSIHQILSKELVKLNRMRYKENKENVENFDDFNDLNDENANLKHKNILGKIDLGKTYDHRNQEYARKEIDILAVMLKCVNNNDKKNNPDSYKLAQKLEMLGDEDFTSEVLERICQNEDGEPFFDYRVFLSAAASNPRLFKKYQGAFDLYAKEINKYNPYRSDLECTDIELLAVSAETLEKHPEAEEYIRPLMEKMLVGSKDLVQLYFENQDLAKQTDQKISFFDELRLLVANNRASRECVEKALSFAKCLPACETAFISSGFADDARYLIYRMARAGIDSIEKAEKALRIHNKSRDTDKFSMDKVSILVNRNLPEWMSLILHKASLIGVLSLDRLGHEKNLFDAAKAWSVSHKIWKKEAEKIGRMELPARMIAGGIIDKMYLEHKATWLKDKSLHSIFWQELNVALKMDRVQAIGEYATPSKTNAKRLLDVLYGNRLNEGDRNALAENVPLAHLSCVKIGSFNRAFNDLLDYEWIGSGQEEKISDIYRKNVANIQKSAAKNKSYIIENNLGDKIDLARFYNTNKQWLFPASISLARIFGNKFPEYLKKTQNYLSKHDACYWLPKDLSSPKCDSFASFLNKNIIYADISGKKMVRKIEEMDVIARNWESLSAEEENLKFKDLLAICRGKKYTNQKYTQFSQEAAKWGINENDYNSFEQYYSAGLKTPVVVDPKIVFSKNGLTGRFLPREDVRVGFFGNYTGCCQHFTGQGKNCAISSVKDAFSQLFVIENDKEEIIAGSWVWRNKANYPDEAGENRPYKTITFDNIEARASYDQASSDIVDIYNQAGRYLAKNHFRRITIGTGNSDVTLDGFKTIDPISLPAGYSGYSDASSQVLLTENLKAKPLEENSKNIYVTGVCQDDLPRLEKIAEICFPEGSQDLMIPEEPKGMILKDDNKLVGYILWTEDANEYCEEAKNVKNWIYDMAVLPEYRKDKNASSMMLLNEMMKHIKEVGGNWGAELRDSTSLRYMRAMAERNVIKMEELGTDNVMSDGSQTVRTVFRYIPEELREKMLKNKTVYVDNLKTVKDSSLGCERNNQISLKPIPQIERIM